MSDKTRDEILSRLKAKGSIITKRILDDDCYTTRDVLKREQISQRTLDSCEEDRIIFSIEFKGEKFWPKFQFDPTRCLSVHMILINQILIDDKGLCGFAVNQFWELTGLDLLKRGELGRLETEAKIVGEHGAR